MSERLPSVCFAVVFALALMRCAGSPALPRASDPILVSAPVDPSPVDPWASTVREVRVQGPYQYIFEVSQFKLCGLAGPTLWLDAPDAFWQQLYAFSPADTIVRTDLSEEVYLDVTATIETLDGPHWTDPRPLVRAASNGYGHGMMYKGRIQVLEVHSMHLAENVDPNSYPSCF